jgi:hypothetical protein
MIQWAAYTTYFEGIPYGEYISTIFIFALCTIGLLKARQIYREL